LAIFEAKVRQERENAVDPTVPERLNTFPQRQTRRQAPCEAVRAPVKQKSKDRVALEHPSKRVPTGFLIISTRYAYQLRSGSDAGSELSCTQSIARW
jgi:hypothetical protein